MRVANVRTGGVLLVALVLVLVGCSVAIPPPDPSSARASSSPSGRSNRSETEPTPEPEVTPSTPDEPPDAIDVHALAFADADHGVLVGGSAWDGAVGVAWTTADGGKTWSKQFTGTAPLDAVEVVGRTTVLAATACDAHASAACVPGVFRSGLRGVGWTPLSAEPLTFLSFPSETTGWGISGRSQTTGPPDGGRLVRTTDGGSTWEPHGISCPATTGRPIAVSFPDLEHGWVACNATFGAGNATKAILRTTDGGATWTVMASAPVPGHGKDVGQIGTNGYLAGVAMAADGVGMAWMGRGVTARTADGGRTWVNMPPGEWDVREADAGWALDDHDWLLHVSNGAGDQPALEATHDGGRRWSIVAVIPAPPSS
jgi:photosystem II stability/assembly factor-like uncharacterized protein